MKTKIEKIIEKAIKNGYKIIELNNDELISEIECLPYRIVIHTRKKYSRKKNIVRYSKSKAINDIIFSIPFTKAFFGERHITIAIDNDGKPYYKEWKDKEFIKTHDIEPAWQYHMRNYVIMEKPLEYFKKFI